MFTKIVTTCNRYEEDQRTKGGVVLSSKRRGALKEYQTVVAVGSNSGGIKEGDLVLINPSRYARFKHRPGGLNDGVVQDNPIIGYSMPIIMLNDEEHMLLDVQDVDYIIEEYEEEEEDIETRAYKANLVVPSTKIVA